MPPVFVINLDRCPERMEKIGRRLAALSLAYTRIEAVDGATLLPERLAAHDEGECRRQLGRTLVAGEIGCFDSHRLAARAILESGAPVGVVLEDDADLPDDMAKLLDALSRIAPDDWDVVNLGRAPKRFAAPHPGLPGLFRAYYFPVTTTAIAWSAEGAARFLAISDGFVLPVDRFLQNWCTATGRGLAMRPAPIRPTGASSAIEPESRARLRRSRNGWRRLAQQATNNLRAIRNWTRDVAGGRTDSAGQ